MGSAGTGKAQRYQMPDWSCGSTTKRSRYPVAGVDLDHVARLEFSKPVEDGQGPVIEGAGSSAST